MTNGGFEHYDLHERSHRAMMDSGFEPAFSPEALRQAEQASSITAPLHDSVPDRRDLRPLLWSSIDNRESLDLDQIEVAEMLPDGSIRLMVGVADVDLLVPANSPIDRHASRNRCSVYTGVEIYPMLPDRLSSNLTSLITGSDRAAIVISMDVDEEGEIVASDIYPATTRNYARLSYDAVGDWLEDLGPMPDAVREVEGMEAQLRLQKQVSQRLKLRRQRAGALDFETIEAEPVMHDGKVVDLSVPRKNVARSMIENLMVSANSTMALYLEHKHIPAIQRIVRSPERWPRIVELAARYHVHLPANADSVALARFLDAQKSVDPVHFPDLSLSIVKLLGPGEYEVVSEPTEHDGHFGLAVHSYTHSTAPNRRFADLVIQRLIKAAFVGEPAPYSPEELSTIARGCTERENAARKVERLMRKAAAAAMLMDRLGDVFDAIVTGASPKGIYVRLLSPPVEGRVTRNECQLDVGDRARVRLIHADPEKGFIDFECLNG